MKFYKYQGTGNDFIIIDNIKNNANFEKMLEKEFVKNICDRRFGVGADGFMIIEKSEKYDFKMRYFNSNGLESTMCGNGGRCIVSFANFLGLIGNKTTFEAINDKYYAEILNNGDISLIMKDVRDIFIKNEKECFLDTGSPHHVLFVDKVVDLDVFKLGKEIRNSEQYHKINGANVNFVEQVNDDTFRVRTYERGVEDETYSCGTGAVASGLSAHKMKKTQSNIININTKGGNLKVIFKKDKEAYTDIELIGEANFVFNGEINMNYNYNGF